MPSTPADLKKISRSRLQEAKILYRAKHYHGAAYLCGYAIEVALKARICNRLHWSEYKFGRHYESYKTHNLSVLLDLSGRDAKVRAKNKLEFSLIEVKWNTSLRYEPSGSISRSLAKDMIEATEILLKVL